jgi:lipooligosaccharide transport system permease protein
MIRLHFQRGILPIFKKVLRQESQGWVIETLTTLAIPLSFFLAFGLGLKGYINNVEGISYLAFLAPGLITMTILLEAYRTGAWGLWLDRWYQKMIDEYRVKPITTSDIIIAEILGGFTVAMVKGTIVALVLSLLAPIHLPWQHLPAYLAYVLPGCIVFTSLGTLIGTLYRKPDQIAQTQTIVITPLLYLGGLFFPINVFPDWLQPFIHWLPTTPLFQGGRQALLSGYINVTELTILWTYGILCFWLSTWLFNKKLSE